MLLTYLLFFLLNDKKKIKSPHLCKGFVMWPAKGFPDYIVRDRRQAANPEVRPVIRCVIGSARLWTSTWGLIKVIEWSYWGPGQQKIKKSFSVSELFDDQRENDMRPPYKLQWTRFHLVAAIMVALLWRPEGKALDKKCSIVVLWSTLPGGQDNCFALSPEMIFLDRFPTT